MLLHCCISAISLRAWHPRQVQRSGSARLLYSNRKPLVLPCYAKLLTSQDGAAEMQTSPLAEDSQELRWGAGAVKGPREAMEDVVHVIQDGRCGFLFASVFDGHAGVAAANYLRDNLYDVFAEQLDMHSLGLDCSLAEREEGLCCPLELHAVLTQCYRKADDSLLQWLKQQSEDEYECGCTATTALVRSDRIIVANVGDSRAVLSRAGSAVDLSTEHRVYGRGAAVASETARVESVGGWIDDGRVCGVLAVSRAFGDTDFKREGLRRLLPKGVEKGFWSSEFASQVNFTGDPVIAEPDVYEMAVVVGQDEFLVLATDGLWDVMSSAEVVQLVRADLKRGKHPRDIAERLAGLAVKRHTSDNVAAVVVDLLGEPHWLRLGAPADRKRMFGLF